MQIEFFASFPTMTCVVVFGRRLFDLCGRMNIFVFAFDANFGGRCDGSKSQQTAKWRSYESPIGANKLLNVSDGRPNTEKTRAEI